MKLIDLNIEGDKHLKKVIDFLRQESPDVICLQEVFQADVAIFEKELNMKGYFSPMMDVQINNNLGLSPRGMWGVLILTNIIPDEFNYSYYVGSINDIPVFTSANSNSRLLQWMKFTKNNQHFTIVNTHFTWSAEGKATPLQRKNLHLLLKVLLKVGPCVLCGDFNAPRGGEIYKELTKNLKDNTPAGVTTTIDSKLHYAGALQKVVDYIFSTPEYLVQDVKIRGGLSDHKALVCLVTNKTIK